MKIFHVSATLTIDMVVLADDPKQAETVGRANWYEDVENSGREPENYYVREVTQAAQVAFLCGDDLVFGPEDRTYEHGASSPQLTLQEYLDQQGIK